MFCSKCGSPLSADAGFCGSCGNAVVRKGTTEKEALVVPEIAAEQVAPVIQSVPVITETSATSESTVQHGSDVQDSLNKVKGIDFAKLIKKYKIAIGSSLGVIVVALLVIFLIIPMFSQGKDSPILYFGENKLLMQKDGQKEPIELSRQLIDNGNNDSWYESSDIWRDSFVQISDDKSKLFFISRIKENGTSNLYYRDLKKKASSWDDEQGVKLATGIDSLAYRTFTISDNGKTVLYIKGYEANVGGKLYLHNLNEEKVVDSRVMHYWYSDDKSVIYYTKTDENEEESLYIVNTSKLDDKVKVDSSVWDVRHFDDEEGIIYYTKWDADKTYNSLTLYSKVYNKDKVKLVSDIESVVSSIRKNEFYYTVAVEENIKFSTLVEDDMLKSDAEMIEPSIEDYQTVVNKPFTDWWSGEVYYQEVTDTNYDAYNLAYDAYNDKQSRDEMRQSLNEEVINNVTTTLFFYSGDKANKVTDDYYPNYFNDISAKYIIYNKYDRGAFSKIKLSDVDHLSEVHDAYDELVNKSPVTYISHNLVHDTPFLEEGTRLEAIEMSSDKKVLYAIESSDSQNVLVSYDMVAGKPTNRKSLDEDVAYFRYISEGSLLLYYKDVNNDTGELYQYSAGKSTRISIDVRMGSTTYYPLDGTLFYMTDYYEDDESGTLYAYKDKKSVKIASEVGSYYYTDTSDLYYLEDFRSNKGYGNLMKFVEKGKSSLIAERVYSMYTSMYGIGI